VSDPRDRFRLAVFVDLAILAWPTILWSRKCAILIKGSNSEKIQ
jgi:hypothetical protein